MKTTRKRNNSEIESFELFKNQDLIQTHDEILAVILKSGEVDRGDGQSIREAIALAARMGLTGIKDDFPEKDFERLQAGRSVSFSSMCRMLSAMGLRFKVEKMPLLKD